MTNSSSQRKPASKLIWACEYLPYTSQDGREIPCYRIYPPDAPDEYIAQTNEDLPDQIQRKHACLIAAAPELLDALEIFFNIMHDYESSLEKGYVTLAMDMARAALATAKGHAP